MFAARKFLKSLSTLFKKVPAVPCVLQVNLSNSLHHYTIRIPVSEHLKDQVKVDIQPFMITIKLKDFSKKINLFEPVDVRNVKTWYHEGVCSIEIGKQEFTPEERLNRMALVMGV